MKKKVLIFIAVILFAGAVFLTVGEIKGKRPFKNLYEEDIKSVSVMIAPPEKSVELNEENIAEFIQLLGDVEFYGKDKSDEVYNGQSIIFEITGKDGSVTSVSPSGDYFIIDSERYSVEYGPSEALSSFANRICETRFYREDSKRFSAEIIEVDEKQMLIEVTDRGSCGAEIGAQIYISAGKTANLIDNGRLKAGDIIHIEFDGIIMESYPLQLGEIYSIEADIEN